MESLKKITIYSGDRDHPAYQRFWRVLETFDQEQLSGYLKYVSGRTRLSHGCVDRHKLTLKAWVNNIPEAHTCFFELDLGVYESDEELRYKLLYGVEHCQEIAEETDNYELRADFGL